MHASGSMPLSLSFSLSVVERGWRVWPEEGLLYYRSTYAHESGPKHFCVSSYVFFCFTLFVIFALFSFRDVLGSLCTWFFSSPYLWICLFTFGFMLLFVLLSSAGKFCCTRAMLFYYFLPRTLRSLIFFFATLKGLWVLLFFSVVTFADFCFVLRYHVIFFFSH